MKKLLFILTIFFASCGQAYETQQPVHDTLYLPAKALYGIKNVDRIFGESLTYNGVVFIDSLGLIRWGLLTDSGYKEMVERAIKKGY